MSSKSKYLYRIGLGVLAVAALALIVARVRATPERQGAPPALTATGVIQAEVVAVASEFGGLIADIPVVETALVAAGTPLLHLDTGLLDAQIASMEAVVAMAEAGLTQARAGARPGQIATAQAQLAQAEAGLLATRRAVSDTQMLIVNPQDINLQIAVARVQLEAAEHQINQAVLSKDMVEAGKNMVAGIQEGRQRFAVSPEDLLGQLPEELVNLLPENLPELPAGTIPDGDYQYGDWELEVAGGEYQLYRGVNIQRPMQAKQRPWYWWQAWIGVNAATAQRDGLQASLNDLYARRANPQQLQTQADLAENMAVQVTAQITMAQAQVAGLEAGATPEQLAALEARVAQAHAGLDALLRQREMYTLTAPISGTVLTLVYHPGEIAARGATLLTLADLQTLYLKVYVPVNQLGQIYLGQFVQVRVDSFPERVFAGQVRHIADAAEFTPRNVATQEERMNLVFAVEVALPNAEGALKPGMPADVTFGE